MWPGQADGGTWDYAARMDQSPPFPPSPSPACCVTGLWSCHDSLFRNRTLRRGKNKKNTPAYTKVNKVIIKKTSLGSRHCFTRAPVAPAPGCPVRSREGESLRGGKDGPRVPAGLRDHGPGTGWCSPRAAARQPALRCGHPGCRRDGFVARSQPLIFCVPLCLESGPKDAVQVLA